jgi:hypothetical protein
VECVVATDVAMPDTAARERRRKRVVSAVEEKGKEAQTSAVQKQHRHTSTQ